MLHPWIDTGYDNSRESFEAVKVSRKVASEFNMILGQGKTFKKNKS